MTPSRTYLSPQQLSDRWDGHVSVGTLRNWRCAKRRQGPPFSKYGNKILYALVDVLMWEAERRDDDTRRVAV